MTIEIVNKEGDLITSYDMESNPFKVGETVHISISNNDKEFWSIKESKGSYVVNKIEHYIRKEFDLNRKRTEHFAVSVEVTKIK